MNRPDLQQLFARPLEEARQRSRITDHLIDKDKYQLYLTSMWTNVVLEMDELGLTQEDLEPALEILNQHARDILGGQEPVIDAFRYLTSTEGEKLMEKEKLTSSHKQMLLYFASVILDPEGHKRWMETVKDL